MKMKSVDSPDASDDKNNVGNHLTPLLDPVIVNLTESKISIEI